MPITTRFITCPLLLLAITQPALVNAAGAGVPVIPLRIADHTFTVEVAHTEATRMRGLMKRTSLPGNRGMLFVFREISRHSMWMVNTPLPLSVAFLDERGVILNIADMTPYTRQAHESTGPSKYAIEMNQGWFKARQIKSGNQVYGLGKAPSVE
jgi:uncharacterized protein